jgi:hypothetical protein
LVGELEIERKKVKESHELCLLKPFSELEHEATRMYNVQHSIYHPPLLLLSTQPPHPTVVVERYWAGLLL